MIWTIPLFCNNFLTLPSTLEEDYFMYGFSKKCWLIDVDTRFQIPPKENNIGTTNRMTSAAHCSLYSLFNRYIVRLVRPAETTSQLGPFLAFWEAIPNYRLIASIIATSV